MDYIREPKEQISPRAITVWRIRDFFSHSITLIVLIIILFIANHFQWFDWIKWILYVIGAYVMIKAIYDLTIKPIYLQRTWRYDIDDSFIQIKSGFLHKQHVIIPMNRVEYVTTNQGPLLRRFRLASITIGTIASSHMIPTLPIDVAEQLRLKIAYLAIIVADEKLEVEVVGDQHD